MGIKTGKRIISAIRLTIISNKRLKKLYIIYIFWSKCLPVSMCIKSGIYCLITVTMSDLSELRLLNTFSKSVFTSSNEILISGVFMNPKESCLLISKSSSFVKNSSYVFSPDVSVLKK